MIYPPTCPVCQATLKQEKLICNECKSHIGYIGEPICMKCGKPLDSKYQEYCYDCSVKTHFFDRGVAVFAYNSAIKKSIYRFKYKNKREYAEFYAGEINKIFGHLISKWRIEALIPVPIHKKRKKQRGYNQAELICRELEKLTGVKCDSTILIRRKPTVPQKQLNNEERKRNLTEAFSIRTDAVKEYRSVLILDDIYTTGSTIDACAVLLKELGIDKVYFITLSIGSGV